MSLIRKLSVGPNFPDGAVHFQVGRPVLYDKVRGERSHTVVAIEEDMTEGGLAVFNVYVENIPFDGELVSTVLWKSISSAVPHVVERGIDFE